jgi:uroporphyrin-III C-methyltransferase
VAARLILIGAGPGDPELLTIKGFKALQLADVVLYDSLVNTKLFDLVYTKNKNPELIFVGKRKGLSNNPQEAINELILSKLKAGLTVVRLKGGDPLIFARGIEEIAIAHNNGYEYQIIPGLTSGLAAASLAGIALTLRDSCSAVHISTGHNINAKVIKSWKAIIDEGSSIIIYMGLSNIIEISRLLKIENLPVIVIANASQEEEKIIHASIETISQELINQQIKSPALIILGKHINQSFKPSKFINSSNYCDLSSQLQ